MKNITLEVFEGPLDLLLHFIKRDRLNIFDIPINKITDEYLEYLNQMETYNIEIASEFLLIASTLVSIKTKMLLPRQEEMVEDYEDPRDELVSLLMEYERFKEIGQEFLKLIDFEKKEFKRPADTDLIESFHEDFSYLEKIRPTYLRDLLSLLDNKLEVAKPKKINTLNGRDISLKDKVKYILKVLNEKNSIFFHDLQYSNAQDEVVTFLSILDLFKRGEITIEQMENFERIKIIGN